MTLLTWQDKRKLDETSFHIGNVSELDMTLRINENWINCWLIYRFA
jgi:hypothetical protein